MSSATATLVAALFAAAASIASLISHAVGAALQRRGESDRHARVHWWERFVWCVDGLTSGSPRKRIAAADGLVSLTAAPWATLEDKEWLLSMVESLRLAK